MTAQDLKNAILQLAVQGKLVPQDPIDEPASELLKRIKAEKECLIKEGEIKREKTLAPISDDEIPFDIPESWEWVHLNQIATSSLGKTMDKAKNNGSLCPYLCSINVYWEGISLSTVKTALFTEEEKSKYALIYGDLLICEGGEVGRSAVWESSDEMYYQNALHRVRFYDKISPYYFRFLMEYLKEAGVIDQYSKGQTIKHLVQGALYSIPMPLPPLAEQQRIVAKIEELMPLVEEYGKAEGRLSALNADFPDKLRKSILQQAIQGKLTERDPADEPASELLKRIRTEKERLVKEGKIKKEKPLPLIKEEEIPFEIPDTWTWVKIGEITQIQSSKRVFEKDYVQNGVPFFRSKEIGDLQRGESINTPLYISREHYDSLKQTVGVPSIGDVLVTSVGTIGNVWICDGREFYYKDGNITQICKNGSFIPEYVELFIHSPLFEQQAISTVAGTAYSALTIIKLKNLLLPLPPLVEQQRIVDRVNELLAVCDELK